MKEKFKANAPEILVKRFCEITLEQIDAASDPKKAQWKPLAASLDSESKPVTLEWDPSLKIYRTSGLPFKSTKLNQLLGL